MRRVFCSRRQPESRFCFTFPFLLYNNFINFSSSTSMCLTLCYPLGWGGVGTALFQEPSLLPSISPLWQVGSGGGNIGSCHTSILPFGPPWLKMLVSSTSPSGLCHPVGLSYLLSPGLWQQALKNLPVFAVYSQQEE